MCTQIPHTNSKCEFGLTLIELLVTIAIIGILLSLALPSFRDFLVGSRLSSDVNGFIGLINYARSEAISRNQSVVICPKSDTTTACASSQYWGQYEVQAFVDVDGSGTRNAGDILLKTIPAIDPTALERGFVRHTSAGKITFRSVGYANTAQGFDIWAVKSGDTAYEFKYGRTVCISSPGRVRVIPYGSNCNSF